MNEKVVLLGPGRSVVGVLTEPDPATSRPDAPAFILLNAGFLHRVGPNRLYVKMARRLAQAGATVLRFDFSGVGDSGPREDRSTTFGSLALEETQAAMDYLARSRGIRAFVLGGLCSGAEIAFEVACRDARVLGGILINGIFGDGQIRTRLAERISAGVMARGYVKRLFRPGSWLRLITGKSKYTMIGRMLWSKLKSSAPGSRAASPAAGDHSQLRALAQRNVRLLFVFSEGSETWEAFRLVHQAEVASLRSDLFRIEVLEGCDHVFTLLWAQHRLIDVIRRWAEDSHAAGARAAAGTGSHGE